MKSIGFNPHSIEGQYGLQMASYLVHQYQPRSVRICTHDPAVAIAAVQCLMWIGDGLRVECAEISNTVAQELGVRLDLIDKELETDVALVLFSRRQYVQPPNARYLVSVNRNALSYKSLLYPGQTHDNVISQLRWFRSRYRLDIQVGLFGLSFLFHWILSLLTGPRLAPVHFHLGQEAIDRLFTTSPVWWLGYLIVLAGNRHT